MEYFNAVLNQVVIFMMIIIVGFIVFKVRALPESVLPAISIFFTKIVVTALIFINTVNGATRAEMINTFFLTGVVAIVYVFLINTMRILPKVLKLQGDRAKIFPVAFSFGNVGFLGIPLLLVIFGQRGMVFVNMFAVIDLLCFWTYGYSQTFPAGHKFKLSLSTFKKMLNPPLIAIILSVILIFLEVRMPRIVTNAFETVANAGLSLPFVYVGGMLATMTDSSFLKRIEIYIGIFVKMLVFPILIFVVMTAFGIDRDTAMATSILFGLPTMAVIPMLAGTNGSDEKYATCIVLVTTIASLFTLTFVTYMVSVVL
ncbi:MAG: AEC family transporter [Oscillospiraceae bacterium]|nr:AEC family transporter [Oscillospiraceae bacterium]